MSRVLSWCTILLYVLLAKGQDTEVDMNPKPIDDKDPDFDADEQEFLKTLKETNVLDDGIQIHQDGGDSDDPTVKAGEGTVGNDKLHPTLMCHQCIQWIIGSKIRIEDKYERRLDQCPTKPCWKTDTICATLSYNVGDAIKRKHGCVNQTVLDTPCPNLRCNKWETQCLNLQMNSKRVLDCGYDNYLSRGDEHICKRLQSNINYAITNCTVSPGESSCVCGALMINLSLTLLFLTVFKLLV